VSNSKSFTDLAGKLSHLKDPAIDKTRKIEKELYLDIKKLNQHMNSRKHDVKINQKDFEGKIEEVRDSGRIPSLRDHIMKPAELTEDFYTDKLFELYKFYAKSFLNLLKYHIRSTKHA